MRRSWDAGWFARLAEERKTVYIPRENGTEWPDILSNYRSTLSLHPTPSALKLSCFVRCCERSEPNMLVACFVSELEPTA